MYPPDIERKSYSLDSTHECEKYFYCINSSFRL